MPVSTRGRGGEVESQALKIPSTTQIAGAMQQRSSRLFTGYFLVLLAASVEEDWVAGGTGKS